MAPAPATAPTTAPAPGRVDAVAAIATATATATATAATTAKTVAAISTELVTGRASVVESITCREKISEPTLENIYDCDCDTVSVNPYFVSQNASTSPKMKNKSGKVSRLSSPFSISSSLPINTRNSRFNNDDKESNVENSMKKRLNSDYVNEEQSSFMKIEELTWQLSRAKHKLKYAGKHQNEPKSVNNEIRMIEESPIDHFYDNVDYVETILLSKKQKNKFSFNEVVKSHENEERNNMSYSENDSNATTINVQNKFVYENKSHLKNFVCSPQSKKEKEKEKYFTENDKFKSEIRNLEETIESYKNIFGVKNLREANNMINTLESKIESQEYLIKNFCQILNSNLLHEKTQNTSDKNDIAFLPYYKKSAAKDSCEDKNDLGNSEEGPVFSSDCEEHSKEHSLSEANENLDTIFAVEDKDEHESKLAIISEEEMRIKKSNENEIENGTIFQLQKTIKNQGSELNSLRKLLFSFRNLVGELSGNFNEEMNKISSIIPIQKEKISELENQCLSLEKQMSMQKEVVQEELSSACNMLLSANNLILLQKKTIESLRSNISELQLEKKSIQNNGKFINNEVVKKVVTPKNRGKERNFKIVKTSFFDEDDNEESKVENGDDRDVKGKFRQERGSAVFFKGVKRINSMAGRGNFFVKKESNKIVKNQRTSIEKEEKGENEEKK